MKHPFPTSPLPQLRVGQPVHVNTRSGWLEAIVEAVAHRNIQVDYYQDGVPAGYSAAVPAHLVWPARGLSLRPVTALVAGDQVADGDRWRTVAGTWHTRDGWVVIYYTTGEQAAVPARTVLRLPTRAGSATPDPGR
jgi:hypothetical protein